MPGVRWCVVLLLCGCGAAVETSDPLDEKEGALRSLHSAMPPVQPGEWLEKHAEPGQTFAQYREEQTAVRPVNQRILYIQTIGGLSAEQERLIDDTAELLTAWYGREVVRLPAVALKEFPESVQRAPPISQYPQLQTGAVLEFLKLRRPEDAVAVLGLTPVDLWPGPGWNFVFGQASLTERVGVWSLARFGDPAQDYERCLLRTLKVATHETGHMLGLKHCTSFACGMNGSNSLIETDRAPLAFCPECEHKVWWTLQLDPAERFQALASYASVHGLEAEEQLWDQSQTAVAATPVATESH
jgi:archaemetzincin